MKKIIAAVLTLALALTTAACGSDSGSENKNGHVADKYYSLLESKDSVYYYEADAVDEFKDEEDPEPMKSVWAEGRDGKDKFVTIEGESDLDQREIETADAHYTVSDADKEYTEEEKEEGDDDSFNWKYTGTSEMDLNGKTYRYDEYQDEFTMELGDEDDPAAETYVYSKRFLVDDQGKLYAMVYINELKGTENAENSLISERTETVTKLQEGSAPDGIFDIPKDYKKIDLDAEETDEGE